MDLPVSVLDLSPVPVGSTGAEALRNSVDLAVRCERLGYRRYWVAEHHNTPGLACSAPEVLIAQIASATSEIRVGSGGVMLPNHAPLRVAESFRVLESLHPGRIDLGIGRAPGSDQMTAFALRRSQEAMSADLPSLVAEMVAYIDGGFPDEHPFSTVRAQPVDTRFPPLWILGSSEESARLAARIGAGYAFAHFLGPRRAPIAMETYRTLFTPSPAFPEPHAILALSAVCAETGEVAEHLYWSIALSVIRMRSGRPGPLPTPDEGFGYDYTASQRDQLMRIRRAQIVGNAESVAAEINDLAELTHADEVMLMTAMHDHEQRVRSYELIASALSTDAAHSGSSVVPPID